MPTIIHDTFTGGSGNLTGHSPETGGAWSQHGTFAGAALNLDGSGAVGPAAINTNTLDYNATAPTNADYDVTGKLNVVSEQDYAYVAGRVDTASATWYEVEADINSGALYLFKKVSGTDTELGTHATGITWATGDTITLSMSGTTIVAKRNGTALVTVTDNAISAKGKAGLGVYAASTSGTKFDEFTVTETVAPSIALSPASVATGTTKNITVTGTGTSFVNGTTTFTPSGVSGVTVNSVTVSSTTSATVNVTVGTNTGVVTLTEGGTGSATVTFHAVIAANDGNVFWPIGALYFDADGRGTVIDNGTYFKVDFTGTSLALSLDFSYYTAASIGSSFYGGWVVSVDGGALTLLQPTTTLLTLASGLSAGTHTIQAWFQSYQEADTWSPQDAEILNGFIVDSGSALASPSGVIALRTKRAMILGDSITNGYDTDLYATTTYPPATLAQTLLLGLNAEGLTCGKSGIGWLHNATGFAQAFPATYDHYYSGQARDMTGLDYLIVCMGTNDGSDVTSTVTTWIASARAAVGSTCWIVLVTPFTSNSRTAEIQAAVTAAADAKCVAVDPSTVLPLISSGGMFKVDSIHPNSLGHAWESSVLTGMVLRATADTGGGTSGGGSLVGSGALVTV